GDARGIATCLTARAIAAFQAGEWLRCLELAGKAEAIYRDQCVGAWWELGTTRQFALSAMYYLGRVGDLGERVSALFKEAEMRGDLLLSVSLATAVPRIGLLARGDVDGALRMGERAMARWRRHAFTLQHYYYMLSQAHILLYQGRGVEAR